MNRRTFLATAMASRSALSLSGQDYSDYSKDPRPDVAEGSWTAGGPDGPIFQGNPVVSGPAADSTTILQPVKRLSTGYLEYAVEGGDWKRVMGASAGLLPLNEHVLKFQLPPLPPGEVIRYRIHAHSIGWTKVRQFYHGEIKTGAPQVSDEFRFKALDPDANSTTFAVWNDTHENAETLTALDALTNEFKPDFLLWNGDQSNDVHFGRDMAGQFLCPENLSIADGRPLAYVRGNHDVRGPAARSLPSFTDTPDDRFYYGFRSGPLAALVMDTGEDKPDHSPYLGGLAAFQQMQQEQADWLKEIVRESWFRDAPHKVMFCHIPLWYKDPQNPSNPYTGSSYCRQLWTPTLLKAGVKLIISGHTHRFTWMPQDQNQPIAQLIGGSPTPEYATFIQGSASNTALKLVMKKLNGSTLVEAEL